MLRILMSVASLALLATAQSAERVIAVRSLQPFLAPSVQSDLALKSALPTEDDHNGASDATLRGTYRSKSQWLIALLKERHADAMDADNLTLNADENVRLAIEGTKGAVNACLADIDTIAATLTRSIEITAYQTAMRRWREAPS